MKFIRKLKYYLFSFSGYAGRLEFSLYFLIGIVCSFYILNLNANTNWNDKTVINLFYIYFLILISFIPIQAATTRRLRDLGLNTAWIIINFIPALNLIFAILLSILKGKKHR